MPDTMIERVARRLCAAHLDSSFGQPEVDANWHKWTDDARDLLTAMREPTEAMMTLAIPRPDYWPPEGENAVKDKIMQTDRRDRATHWRAMIDAALAEEG